MNLTKSKLHIAVLAALPLMALTSFDASAACSPGNGLLLSSTQTCDAGSDFLNLNGITVSNTTTADGSGNRAVVDMVGNGNTFSNAGIITNLTTDTDATPGNISSGNGSKYGLYMGSDTADDANLTNAITNTGTINSSVSNVSSSNSFTTKGVNVLTVVGVGTDVAGIYTLNNSGTNATISASHNGVGRVNGVEAGGNVTSMSITNSGHITGTASDAITRDVSTATSFTGHTVNFGTAVSIGVAAGIYAEEEVAALTITNSGTIAGVGTYASGIYTRADDNTIANTGTISGTKIGVAQVSDSGENRSMELDNSGTITGDILSVNGAALRWWSLSNGEGTGGATIDSRLNINSQFGQADSEITNSGTITGNFYYSNGTHVLTNEDGATITGNIDLDQRDTIAADISTGSVDANYSELGPNATQTDEIGGKTTITTMGTKAFTFDNAGTVTGDITIRDVVDSTNTITLTDDGFTGKIIATTNSGTNTLNLEGTGTLKDNVTFGELKVGHTVVGEWVLEDGKTFNFKSVNIAAGNTFDLSSNAVTLGGTLTIADDVTVKTTIGKDSHGSFVGVTSGTVDPGATILPTVLGTTVKVGDDFIIANNTTGVPLVENTSALVTWSASHVDADLVLSVDSIKNAATVDGVTALSAGAINALMTATGSTIGGSVQNLTSAEDIERAGQQLRPEANNASTQAAMAAANQVSSVIGAHQEAVRTASNGNSGVSTGETAQGAGFWMQGFGFRGEQKERGGVDGYTADTGGFVLGGDKTIGNGDVRVGAAFAYASTGINGEGVTTANRTDIDSYQGTVYGTYNAGAWYVDAALGYGQHQYDTKRYVALAGASITGKHDANQYLAKVGVGYPLAFGKATFTPLASLAYVNLDQDGYTETDPTASGAALTVGSTKTDSFRSGLGAKVSVPLSTGALNTALEARAIWNHEFADTKQDIASSFVGGTSFTTNGVAHARDSANLGLGVSLNSANGQTLSVNYDAEVKSDYVSHTAALKFRYDF